MADITNYTPTVDVSDVNDEVWFDIINRTITPKNPDAIEDILVQNDANSRNFGFMIQRYFEEEDLSTKQIRIHYVNSLNMHDIAEAHSIEIVGNSQDVLSFKWLVGNKACVEAGAMKFAVEFYDNEGYELYTKAITVNITEGIYVAGEIPNPDDWYVTFKRELNELSNMYNEIISSKDLCRLSFSNIEQILEYGFNNEDVFYFEANGGLAGELSGNINIGYVHRGKLYARDALCENNNVYIIDLTTGELSVKPLGDSSIVTSINENSTDTQIPSAKLLYDTIGDIETLLSQI